MLQLKYFMSDNRQGTSTSSSSEKADPPSPHDDESSTISNSPLAASVILPEIQVQLHVHTNRWAPSQGRLPSTVMQGETSIRTTGRPNNHSLQISSNQLTAAIPCGARGRGRNHNHTSEAQIQTSRNNENDTMERLIASQSLSEVIQDNSMRSGNIPTNGSVPTSPQLLNDHRPSLLQHNVNLTQNGVVDDLARFAVQQLINGLSRFPAYERLNQHQSPMSTAAVSAATNNDVSNGGSSSRRMINSETLASGATCQPVGLQHLGDAYVSSRETIVKTRRVACRARGMPPTHNAETAYFEVPDNVKHGDELVCTYPECRNAGVKFCFCTHCNIPVAKRNFRIRHNHCDYAPPAPTVAEAFSFPTQDTNVPGGRTKVPLHPTAPTNSKRRKRSCSDSRSCSPSSIGERGRYKKRKAVDIPLPPPVQQITTRIDCDPDANCSIRNHSTSHGDAGSDGDSSSVSDLGTDEIEITAERMAAWDQLLEKRPRRLHSSEMHPWLMTVLAISDVDIPVVNQSETSSGRTSTEPLHSSDSAGDDHRKISKRPKW